MPLFFFSLFACVFVIFSSPSFFPIIENDSFSYINNESIRLSLYPYLIDLFEENLKRVIYFQIIVFSISIASITLALKKKKNLFNTNFNLPIFYFSKYLLYIFYKNNFDRVIIYFIYKFFDCSNNYI